MTITTTLLLITTDPNHPLATLAYRFAKAFLEQQSTTTSTPTKLTVFFYGEAAHTANKLRWQTADRDNLTQHWSELSQQYKQPLPVCVSTALTRGVTDADNAKRHNLSLSANDLHISNLADGFELVGLGDLANALAEAQKVLSF